MATRKTTASAFDASAFTDPIDPMRVKLAYEAATEIAVCAQLLRRVVKETDFCDCDSEALLRTNLARINDLAGAVFDVLGNNTEETTTAALHELVLHEPMEEVAHG